MIKGSWRGEWYVVPYDVIFRDLDYFGHVNNAVYLTYFEWARAVFWFDMLEVEGLPGDIGFIVARAECDFRRQIGMERIEIGVRISAMGNTSLTFEYQIWRDRGAEIAATGKVVVVLFDWQTRSKMAITEDLKRRMLRHGSARPDTPGGGAAAVS